MFAANRDELKSKNYYSHNEAIYEQKQQASFK